MNETAPLNGYLIFAYVIGLALLWGYALLLWSTARGLRKRERSDA